MSSLNHHKLFFIAFFYWLIYSSAELMRPGLVSTYVNLYALFAFLCVYGCWIVVMMPDDAPHEPKFHEILLVSIGAGAILYAVGLVGILGAMLAVAMIFLVFLAFYIL